MGHLSRRISPLTLFMLSMNGIIGSGWLFAPMYAAKIAGPAAIFSWAIGGFAILLVALTFAELSTMFPVAGGTAHIPQISHGPFASFILSWIAWLTCLVLAPIEVQAVIQYASLYYPQLMHLSANGLPVFTGWGYFWATILMLGLSLANILSYKGLMRFNFLLFAFKFSVILITIFAILKTQFHVSNFSGSVSALTTSNGWHAIFSAIATGGIILAFNGFKSGVELAGEAKNLAVSIPLGTVGSVIGVLLLYLGLQVCFIGAIDPKSLAHGWQHLSFTGDVGPFVGLVAALGLFFLVKLLYANAMISPLGAGLIYVTSTARILFAMSEMGYVPKFLTKVNRQHLPVYAIMVNFALGMLSFLPLPGWQTMVNFLVSAIVITYAMGPISLICLRYSMPLKERPFRLPLANIICMLAFYSCNLFSFWTGWDTISKLGIALAVGMGIFLLSYLRGNIQIKKSEFKSALWIIPYLAGLIILSYLGTFGGIGVLPFGWDFLAVGSFSVIIIYLAIACRAEANIEQVNDYFSHKSLVTT